MCILRQVIGGTVGGLKETDGALSRTDAPDGMRTMAILLLRRPAGPFFLSCFVVTYTQQTLCSVLPWPSKPFAKPNA
jgi:hypothetical protein